MGPKWRSGALWSGVGWQVRDPAATPTFTGPRGIVVALGVGCSRVCGRLEAQRGPNRRKSLGVPWAAWRLKRRGGAHPHQQGWYWRCPHAQGPLWGHPPSPLVRADTRCQPGQLKPHTTYR